MLTATGAEIQKADILASNGIVHIIGKVMTSIPTGLNLPDFLEIQPELQTLMYFLKVIMIEIEGVGPGGWESEGTLIFKALGAKYDAVTPFST